MSQRFDRIADLTSMVWNHGRRALQRTVRPRTAILDPHRLIWIDPQSITHRVFLRGSKYTHCGLVAGGDWDFRVTPLRDSDVWTSLVARFRDGAAWEDTAYYRRFSAEIAAGGIRWNCRTLEDFQQRLARLDQLHEDIVQRGYKSQTELMQENDARGQARDQRLHARNEVMVCIGRMGNLLLRDDQHRLTIAQIAGVRRIPAAVSLRHARWHSFCRDVEHAARNAGNVAPQPAWHPDLEHVVNEEMRRRCDQTIDLLSRLGIRRILEIGAGWGYLSHRVTRAGLDGTALEEHPRHLYFLQAFRQAAGADFRVLDAAAVQCGAALDEGFPAAVVVNPLRQYARNVDGQSAFLRIIQRAKCNVVILAGESAANDGSSSGGNHVLAGVLQEAGFVPSSVSSAGRNNDGLRLLARPPLVEQFVNSP